MSYLTYYFEVIDKEPLLTIVARDGKTFSKPILIYHEPSDRLQSIIRPTLQTRGSHEARFCPVMNEIYIAYRRGDETTIEKMYPAGGELQVARWSNEQQMYEDLGPAKYRGQNIYTGVK